MLGDNHRLRRKLREQGKRADAEIVDFAKRFWGMSTGREGWQKPVFRFKLRVHPSGEDAFDADFTEEWTRLERPRIGMRVPVLYDPDDHSKVVFERKDRERFGFRQYGWASEQAEQPGPDPHASALRASRDDKLKALQALYQSGSITKEQYDAAVKRRLKDP